MKKLFLILTSFLLLISIDMLFAQQYILIGWNDLGMHCSNKDFSKMAVLPPYNNIHAQLIFKSSASPQVVTTGYTVEYSIPGNTYSVGKTNFWNYAQQLFNLPSPLTPNIGLTGNGLTGTMVPVANYFIATGIPTTPYTDDNLLTENPYQLIHLVAKAVGNDSILATTDVVIPVSNEITCVSSGCHSSEQGILNQHESVAGFNSNGPNLCANCHASNALGTPGIPEAGIFSEVIHNKHKDLLPANQISTCYKCHPGEQTQCLRDVMGKNPTNPLICQDCHGTMSTVASSISNGRRPWLDEPKCGDVLCHSSNYAEEPNKLFRESQGHGGMYCSACHGSPHAILPTVQPNDNIQNINLQGFAGTLQVCSVCHGDNPTSGGPHQGATLFFQLSVTVSNDWNMVSIPGLHPLNQNVNTWWPYRNPLADVYKWITTTYVPVTLSDPGEGYWMLHTGNLTYNTGEEWPASGMQIVAHDPIPLTAGWNMIGGYENSPLVSGLTTTPSDLIVGGTVYGWTGTYTNATNLLPGYGYWILSTGNGVINPPTLLDGTTKLFSQDDRSEWGKIIITDASGKSYTLYSVNGEVNLDQYQMPPLPPTGIFDVRFGSNRKAENLREGNQTIEMQGLTYPVTVRVEKMGIKLADETGKLLSERIKSGEEVVISNSGIYKLLVSGDIVPNTYALEQNYPNPFNPSTKIEFSIPEDVDNVTLTIFNELGQRVAELVNSKLEAGKYSYVWDAGEVATGLYLYELRTDKFVSVKKMILLK